MNSVAAAGGLFGPPQTVSREAGGLNTAIGYRYHEDTFTSDTDRVVRQNQIYSQVAYGDKNRWEIYGRIGISDLKIFDAFHSTSALTTTVKNDFEENWKFFGSWGPKDFIRLIRFSALALLSREPIISVTTPMALPEAIMAHLTSPTSKLKIYGM